MTRRALKTDLIDDKTDVTSDGRTVWVNAPVCVARFCPISREFFPTVEQSWTIQHDDMKPTSDDWKHFVEYVQSLFAITIADHHHRPLYLGGRDVDVN